MDEARTGKQKKNGAGEGRGQGTSWRDGCHHVWPCPLHCFRIWTFGAFAHHLQGLEVMDPKLGLGFVHAPSSAALVEAACTNLARCKPGIVSPHEEVEVGLICRPGPSAFRLLAFFPKLTQLGLVMEVGEEEVAALGQTGSAVKGVKSISCRAGVRPDFWSPTLWAVLPRLREIDLSWAVLTSPAPIEAMAQCCAAAPRPVTITGPWRDGANEYAALKARLAELPGCMARLE